METEDNEGERTDRTGRETSYLEPRVLENLPEWTCGEKQKILNTNKMELVG